MDHYINLIIFNRGRGETTGTGHKYKRTAEISRTFVRINVVLVVYSLECKEEEESHHKTEQTHSLGQGES